MFNCHENNITMQKNHYVTKTHAKLVLFYYYLCIFMTILNSIFIFIFSVFILVEVILLVC